jgi:hypothetical protein
MYRSKRFAALLMIIIGSTWLIYSLIMQYTHITNPFFVWVIGAVVIGILMQKRAGKRRI